MSEHIISEQVIQTVNATTITIRTTGTIATTGETLYRWHLTRNGQIIWQSAGQGTVEQGIADAEIAARRV